eukprot:3030288-Rhodomonas_salina.1
MAWISCEDSGAPTSRRQQRVDRSDDPARGEAWLRRGQGCTYAFEVPRSRLAVEDCKVVIGEPLVAVDLGKHSVRAGSLPHQSAIKVEAEGVGVRVEDVGDVPQARALRLAFKERREFCGEREVNIRERPVHLQPTLCLPNGPHSPPALRMAVRAHHVPWDEAVGAEPEREGGRLTTPAGAATHGCVTTHAHGTAGCRRPAPSATGDGRITNGEAGAKDEGVN